MILPNIGNTTFSFKGFVSSMPANLAFDAVMMLSVELVIMGDPEPTLV
jgi:hypothetical protein